MSANPFLQLKLADSTRTDQPNPLLGLKLSPQQQQEIGQVRLARARVDNPGMPEVGPVPEGYDLSLSGAGNLMRDVALSVRGGVARGIASVPDVAANLWNAGVDRVGRALDPLELYPERVQGMREAMMVTDPSIPLPRIATIYDEGVRPGALMRDGATLRSQAETISQESADAMSLGAQAQDSAFEQTTGFSDTVVFLLQNPAFAARLLAGELAEEAPALAVPGGAYAKAAAGGVQAGALNTREVRDAVQQAAPEQVQQLAELWGISGADTEAVRAELLRTAPTRTFERSAALNTLLQGLLPGARKVEELLAGVSRAGGTSRLGSAARGAAGEAVAGAVGEVGDEVLVNDALGRALDEGLGKAAAMGLVLDGAAGGLAGLAQRGPAGEDSSEARSEPEPEQAPPEPTASAAPAAAQRDAGEGGVVPALAERLPRIGGKSRIELIQAWQDAATDDARAEAAADIAAFDARARGELSEPSAVSAEAPGLSQSGVPAPVFASAIEGLAFDEQVEGQPPPESSALSALPPAPDTAALIPQLMGEIGWLERGGRMFRDPNTAISRADQAEAIGGDVSGRTEWLARPDALGRESDFWRNRPGVADGNGLTEAEAKDAVQRWRNGQRLGVRQKTFVDYLQRSARDYAEEFRIEQERMRAELVELEEQGIVEELAELRAASAAIEPGGEREALSLEAMFRRAVELGVTREELVTVIEQNPERRDHAREIWSLIKERSDANDEQAGPGDSRSGAEAEGRGQTLADRPGEAAPQRAEADVTADGVTRPDIPEFAGLTASQREVERRARDQVLADPEAALEAYTRVPGTDGGRIINTDEAREIFADYNAGPEARSTYAAAVHEPSSWVAKEVYRRRMARPAKPGEYVYFTGGGTGAGKSTGPKRIPAIGKLRDNAETEFDGNLQTLKGAVEKIDMALESGRGVRIVYTFRDPVQAFTHGALPRAERADYGRTVPIPAHVGTHIGAARTYLELQEHYKDDPRVTIQAVWNDYDGERSSVEIASREQVQRLASLDRDTLEQEVRNELERLNQAGRVSVRVYRGSLGDEAVRADASEVRPGRREEGAGRVRRLVQQSSDAEVAAEDPQHIRLAQPGQRQSGIPSGLPAQLTDTTRQLNARFNRWLRSRGRGAEQVRFQSVDRAALPADVAEGIRAIEAAIGVSVEVVRNLTPEVERFNGFTFGDGQIAIDERADQPATLVAMHEWVHSLRDTAPDLYERMAAEVRRQGRLPAWANRMAAEGNRTDPDGVVEELVADAVADAFTDADFLRSLGQRDVGLFQQAAEAILRFLDSLLDGTRGRGTADYLKDVQAFREELAAVLREFDRRSERAAPAPDDAPRFQRPGSAVARLGALQGQQVVLGQIAAQGYPLRPSGWNYQSNRWEGIRGQYLKARAALQDKFIALREAQQDIETTLGGLLDDASNAYRLENLAHGRVGDRMDKLERDVLQPIQQLMRKHKLTMAQLQDYLLARHAPERNAKVASINADMPDGGSGISTADAQAILAGSKPGPYSGRPLNADARAALAKVAALADRMREQTLNAMVEAGTVSKQQAAQLRAAYRYYVPLRGKGEADDFGGDNGRPGGAGRIDFAGPRVRRALGRGDGNLPQHLFAELLGDAQRAIVAAELGKVRQAFLRLAMRYPNSQAWTVEPVDMEYRFSEATGEAYLAVKSRAGAEADSLLIPLNGKTYRVRIEHPQLREALLNLGESDLGVLTRVFGAINRWQAATLTRYNPGFVPINLLRDLGFGVTGVASEYGAKTAAQVLASYAPAANAIWRDLRAGKRGDAAKPNAQKEWIDWAREFVESGAKTAIMRYDDIESISRSYERGVRALGDLWRDGLAGKAQASLEAVKRAGGPLLDVIDHANDSIENALRLSLYVSLRRQGHSIERAAEAAKNLTVNFNRKGRLAAGLNAIFLFWNAAVQGSHRVVKVLRDPRVLAGLTALGTLQGLFALSMMADDEDGDGVSTWDMVPEWRRLNSFIIPAPWHEHGYLAIPMPYGFNMFTFTGGRVAQWSRDAQRDDKRATAHFLTAMFSAAVRSFSPVPMDDSKNMLGNVPGILLQLASNRDDLGRPITPETYGRPTPAASAGRTDTPEVFKDLATLLNRIGGGSDDELPVFAPVITDVSPDTLEFLWREATGGIGSTLTGALSLVEGTQGGRYDSMAEALAAAPIVRSFGIVGSADRAVAERYYRIREELQLVESRAKRAAVELVQANGGDLAAAAADWPAVRDSLGPLAQGLEPERYKANGRHPDGTRYREGDFKTNEAGGLALKPADGSPIGSLKNAHKVVQEQMNVIREAHSGDLSPAERENAIKEAARMRREAQQEALRVIQWTRME
jgi:hypothetical protein